MRRLPAARARGSRGGFVVALPAVPARSSAAARRACGPRGRRSTDRAPGARNAQRAAPAHRRPPACTRTTSTLLSFLRLVACGGHPIIDFRRFTVHSIHGAAARMPTIHSFVHARLSDSRPLSACSPLLQAMPKRAAARPSAPSTPTGARARRGCRKAARWTCGTRTSARTSRAPARARSRSARFRTTTTRSTPSTRTSLPRTATPGHRAGAFPPRCLSSTATTCTSTTTTASRFPSSGSSADLAMCA